MSRHSIWRDVPRFFVKSQAETSPVKLLLRHRSRLPPTLRRRPVWHRTFHTSSRRPINPILAVLLKTKGIKVLKGLSIIFGRTFRVLHSKLPESIQTQLTRHKIFFLISSVTLPVIGHYSYTHYEACPITGRKRWITFTKEQVAALSEFDRELLLKEHGEKLLDGANPIYERNLEIVDKLLKANQDLDFIKQTNWKLHVIDDAAVTNAFVLPSGDIFVFTGMMKMLNTWEEMAVILGHEIAHAILGHSQEQQSYLSFGELLTVPLLAFIWFFFDDFAAFLVYTIQQKLYPLVFEYGFHLPYSRLLESEADEVGLLLAAKACFDPRWSVLLWEKMAMKEVLESDGILEEFDYLSTHPSNQKRSIILEQKLPEVMEVRKKCNCPALPLGVDPEAAAHKMRKCIDNVKQRKLLMEKLAENSSILEKNPQTGSLSTERGEKLEEAKKESEVLMKKLKELEMEYGLLVTIPEQNAAQESADKVRDTKKNILATIWYNIMDKIATTGKLTDTLYESEKTKLNTVDIKKSAFGKT